MIELREAAPSEFTQVFINLYSQFGEDGILAEIFRRIGTTNKQCFEVGAADGKWFSNSRKLIDEGWRAALIEAEEKNWPELEKLEKASGGRVIAFTGRVEPAGGRSLDSILSMAEFDAHPDLGVIDVDGQEYYLWNGMMNYRPRVMMVEYDADAEESFVPDLNGLGQASLAAICSVAVSKGYFNAYTTATNAIFIHGSEKKKFFAAMAETVRFTGDAKEVAKQPDYRDNPVVIETPKVEEKKLAAILSRPRFGLNVFWDCASEALAPWGVPLQSSYGVFWDQVMERMFEENIEQGADWILSLDYDSVFSSKHIQKLIDVMGSNPNVDAIAGLQVRRGKPAPLAVRSDGKMPLTGGPVQVRTAHFGLTLFRAESFKRLKKKPWFYSQPAADGSWSSGRMDPDIAFWANWGDSGNSLFVHTGCRIGHVEEMVSEYDESGNHRHLYLSEWRTNNGHRIKNFE